jgi:MFS family permease
MTLTDASSDSESRYPKPAYAWYVAILLMPFYVLSFMDRIIIAVLIEPIKADLALTDVQMSLLGGLSFAIFYSIVGIFIGRLADSMNRTLLISVGVFIWSLTTALCGFVGRFWQLLILRMGVGLGESALLPSTISLLADYFPPRRVATPTSVFLFGAPIGIGLSFVIGGYLLETAQDMIAAPNWGDVPVVGSMAAWQLVLFFLGVIGMVMTLALVTVREPRSAAVARHGAQPTVARTAEPARLDEVGRYARHNGVAIWSLYFGMALVSLAAYAQGIWDYTFLSRTYGIEPAEIGLRYGFVQMGGGLAGMFLAGFIADRLSARGVEAASLRMVIVGCAISAPFSFLYPMADSVTASLWLMIVAIFGSNMGFACAASAIQRMFPGSMLGLAAGVYYFISNAIGMGVGPTAVAALTDYVYQDPEMIRHSLMWVGGISRSVAFVLILAGFPAYRRLLRQRSK